MKTHRKAWLLTFASCVLLLPFAAQAATVRGQVVYSANNAPAVYVAVRLTAPDKGASEFAYTGNDGRYYLSHVPAGSYRLEVWRGNRVVLAIPVTVQEPSAELSAARLP